MTVSFGEMKDGEYVVHGVPLTTLMKDRDVISALWFLWTGENLSESERRLVELCFVACLDHGTEPPSAHVTRTVASCGKPLADAVAAGILTLGPRHGNAAGVAAQWIRDAVEAGRSASDVVCESLAASRRLPGLGHPVYESDPRTQMIFTQAKETFAQTPHVEFVLEAARSLSAEKGKTMPVNIDGAIGAVMCELGAPADLADAIFLCARTIGLVAQAREEAGQSSSYRRG